MTSGKRLVKSKSGLRMVFQHDKDMAPWDMSEPPWVPDEEAQICSTCSAKFDFLKRKHHCRRCGKIFCSKCCAEKVHFHRMGFVDPVRHCVSCAAVTKGEGDFFFNHIKILFNGAPFHVSTESSPASSPTSDVFSFGSPLSTSSLNSSNLYHLKLSSDQRSILFDPYESSLESGSIKSGSDDGRRIKPIDLVKIQYHEMNFEEEDRKALASGITLHVKVSSKGELVSLKLMSPPEPSKKPSVVFVNALNKGLQMLIESRHSPVISDDS